MALAGILPQYPIQGCMCPNTLNRARVLWFIPRPCRTLTYEDPQHYNVCSLICRTRGAFWRQAPLMLWAVWSEGVPLSGWWVPLMGSWGHQTSPLHHHDEHMPTFQLFITTSNAQLNFPVVRDFLKPLAESVLLWHSRITQGFNISVDTAINFAYLMHSVS